ncbi:hypothetical protein [Phenylobacterium sp.]|jgi:FixJ family two-component response regulator|uniref:hypothetical protein n=1 Tax=Phenylobacterium sp. TaxID=1871053 RepID=UPI002F42EA9E
MKKDKAIVVLADAAIASSLEIALLAAGLAPTLFEPEESLDRLPVDAAAVLIVDPAARAQEPLALVEELRSRDWPGLTVLITGDRRSLLGVIGHASRIAILEMPFVAADLIAAISSHR